MKILSTTEVTKKIESARKSGMTFQNAVQAAATSIVVHLAKNRDKTLLISLYSAMPNGSRRKVLVDWMKHYIRNEVDCLEITASKDGLSIDLAPQKSPEWIAFQERALTIAENMDANPWHAYAAPNTQAKVDLTAIIEYLGRKSNSKDADDEIKAKIAKIKAFAEELNG